MPAREIGGGKKLESVTTLGDVRALLGRMLARVENGTVDATEAKSAATLVNALNQTFAEETKRMLAHKELGLQLPVGSVGLDKPAITHEKDKGA